MQPGNCNHRLALQLASINTHPWDVYRNKTANAIGCFLHNQWLVATDDAGTSLCRTSVSLPRDRFWDIQVSKIDSPTRQPLLPRPSCVRAASPHLRKLGAGYAALPQMTGRDFSYAYFVSPLRYRTPDKQCGPGRYRGLTAFASLSMAVSEGSDIIT